jgi:predicted AAA+ superfamily ATPase
VNKVGFGFSPNTGKLLENLLLLTVQRTTQDIYYFSSPGGYEVDFYLPETLQLIQVTQNWNQASTCDRKVWGLQHAARLLKPKNSFILTDANQKDFEIAGVPVRIRFVAKLMLNPYRPLWSSSLIQFSLR